VTMPLEQSIRRVPGLHEMRSTTSRGSSEINLNFDWGSDMDLALSRVQALASSIRDQLPAGTSLDARLMSPTLFPVVGLSLTSPQRSQIELRDMAELQLRPALARLPGVSEVVLINLLRQQSASTVTLADALTSWLASHRSELPPDVSVGIFYDQADLIRASIGSVRDGLLVGGLLAIAIIAAFIGSPFLGALAAVVLPG